VSKQPSASFIRVPAGPVAPPSGGSASSQLGGRPPLPSATRVPSTGSLAQQILAASSSTPRGLSAAAASGSNSARQAAPADGRTPPATTSSRQASGRNTSTSAAAAGAVAAVPGAVRPVSPPRAPPGTAASGEGLGSASSELGRSVTTEQFYRSAMVRVQWMRASFTPCLLPALSSMCPLNPYRTLLVLRLV
jgi:hypothetical protein